MNPVEAAAFCAEFDAQADQLQHVTRELTKHVDHPADLAAIEEAHRLATSALMTLARVAARTPDRARPRLAVVR